MHDINTDYALQSLCCKSIHQDKKRSIIQIASVLLTAHTTEFVRKEISPSATLHIYNMSCEINNNSFKYNNKLEYYYTQYCIAYAPYQDIDINSKLEKLNNLAKSSESQKQYAQKQITYLLSQEFENKLLYNIDNYAMNLFLEQIDISYFTSKSIINLQHREAKIKKHVKECIIKHLSFLKLKFKYLL